MAADTIAEGIEAGDTSEAQLRKWEGPFVKGMDRIRRLVCEYYDGLSFGRRDVEVGVFGTEMFCDCLRRLGLIVLGLFETDGERLNRSAALHLHERRNRR